MKKASCATPEGTRRYAERLSAIVSPAHFRHAQGLWMSSIGLGTYLGHHDEHTDRMYEEAIKRAVELGCNVIDSAINYRFQRSERAIGAALRQLFDSGKASRDEIIIATKGGYFPFDGEPPRDPRRWVTENLINTGVAHPSDIVGSHCMSPSYLDDQLGRSLENLGLECVDIYYIHNPESQLDGVARGEFLNRMRKAFEFLESAVAAGRIGLYGTATWNGYRQPPGARSHLSLAELAEIARDVGGEGHHFRVIQLPLNLAMPEALTSENQALDGGRTSPLMAAGKLGITVMCSASLLQAQLTAGLPPFIGEALTGLQTDAQRAIQFARSAPGVTTALIGMSQRSHVEENMMVAQIPPAPIEDFLKIFSREGEEAN
ncbi:MAG TPA: aldo/keto reductase, partial [Blastocatellia bacterium]|nr:aldo/keto reductase [Blastocatellia bacterium]